MTAAGLPSVSVVMPTYNRCELLPRVLTPLLDNPEVAEVVVVVDGSPDGSLDLLGQMAHDHPRLRPVGTENRGMMEARMAGAQLATGDVVLLLDDDVVIDPEAVLGHARAHAAQGSLLVVGAMPVAGGDQAHAGDYPRAMYAAEYRRHTSRWLRDPASILSTLWAGHMSISRRDLLRIAPAAPEIGRGYHSDIDFGLRCQRAGLRGVYDPALHAVHLYTRDPTQFMRDAASSGRSLALLHRVHPELGAFSDERLLSGLPRPVRSLVRAGVTREPPVALVTSGIEVFGRLGLFGLQRRTAFLRWLIGQLRGAAELERDGGG